MKTKIRRAAVRCGQQQDGERGEERQVRRDEDAAGDVAHGVLQPVDRPPQQDRHAGQAERTRSAPRPRRRRPRRSCEGADQRWARAGRGSAPGPAPRAAPRRATHDRRRREDEEALLADEQAGHDERAEPDAHADGGREVATGPGRGRRRGRQRRRRRVATGSPSGRALEEGGEVLMCGEGGTSDLEQLGFLVLEQLVDRVDVLLGQAPRAPSRRGCPRPRRPRRP